MRSFFIDPSALLAVLAADDDHYPPAKRAWAEILAYGSLLVASHYILVEPFSLEYPKVKPEPVDCPSKNR